MNCDGMGNIYIIVSQTGTMLSKILKFITGAQYNHVSLGLSNDLKTMYSFGRKNAYNPFWGGFVTESADFGTFKRFSKTQVIVLRINVGQQKQQEIAEQIKFMLENKKRYGYNYFGLCLAGFKIAHKSENRYYCSEFVRDILQKNGVEGSEILKPIVEPIHFLQIPKAHTVYTGRLSTYSPVCTLHNMDA